MSEQFDDFLRYLEAKKSVDDRALNIHVWRRLKESLPDVAPGRPLRLLELGAGIGTMVERLVESGMLPPTHYTAIDAAADAIALARKRLSGESGLPEMEWEAIDFFDFAERERGRRQWDFVVANAFLDLVDLDRTLPLLWDLLVPGGLLYFTINFDGLTIFQPPLDPVFEEQLLALYHRTMDVRRDAEGRPAGHSETGRRLFNALQASGASLLAAGSSDWVVFAEGKGNYPADEAYFLHFIVATIGRALAGHPRLDSGRLQRWVGRRHEQIARGKLIYVAHQLDFLGRGPG